MEGRSCEERGCLCWLACGQHARQRAKQKTLTKSRCRALQGTQEGESGVGTGVAAVAAILAHHKTHTPQPRERFGFGGFLDSARRTCFRPHTPAILRDPGAVSTSTSEIGGALDAVRAGCRNQRAAGPGKPSVSSIDRA